MRYSVIDPKTQEVASSLKGRGKIAWTSDLVEAKQVAELLGAVIVDSDVFLISYLSGQKLEDAILASKIG